MSESVEQEELERERRLLDSARAGNRPALETLLRMHQDRIYRTALSFLGGDSEGAMEVAQDVMISMAKNLSTFRGDSRLTTWLYRMTINYGKNWLAAKGRRTARFVSMEQPAHGDEEGGRTYDAPDKAPTPREQAAISEMQALVQARLAQLPEEFRSAMILRFVEDRSYEEISEALGVPIGTVKSRINRGRAELKTLMSDVLPTRRSSDG